MKFIIGISLLFSLLFSSQSRLVVGSFQYEKNAKRMTANIENIIKNDKELKNFLDKNSIKVTYGNLGKYYAVSFEPFYDSKTKFITYFKIKKRYADTYSLDITNQNEAEYLASNNYNEQEVPQAKKDTKDSINQLSTTSKPKESALVQKETTQKQEEIKQSIDTLSSTKTATKKQEDDSNNKLPYLIPLLVVVLILVILIVYFTQRKPKKTLQTLKENFEEDLS